MALQFRTALTGQYGASLKMLAHSLDRAHPDAWSAPVGKFPFWHVAYHALFITDLYLSPREAEFRPRPFHREDYEMLGPAPWAPDKRPVVDQPYDHATLSRYVGHCRAKAERAVEGEGDEALAGPSGFDWLPFTRLELHLYNVRHLQHHVGQLCAALRREGVEPVRWAVTGQR